MATLDSSSVWLEDLMGPTSGDIDGDHASGADNDHSDPDDRNDEAKLVRLLFTSIAPSNPASDLLDRFMEPPVENAPELTFERRQHLATMVEGVLKERARRHGLLQPVLRHAREEQGLNHDKVAESIERVLTLLRSPEASLAIAVHDHGDQTNSRPVERSSPAATHRREGDGAGDVPLAIPESIHVTSQAVRNLEGGRAAIDTPEQTVIAAAWSALVGLQVQEADACFALSLGAYDAGSTEGLSAGEAEADSNSPIRVLFRNVTGAAKRLLDADPDLRDDKRVR